MRTEQIIQALLNPEQATSTDKELTNAVSELSLEEVCEVLDGVALNIYLQNDNSLYRWHFQTEEAKGNCLDLQDALRNTLYCIIHERIGRKEYGY